MSHRGRNKNLHVNNMFKIPLQNQYSVFNQNVSNQTNATIVQQQNSVANKTVNIVSTNTNKINKIPPIVVKMKSADAYELMKECGVKDFKIQIMSIGLKVFFANNKNFEKVVNKLKDKDIEYFSYTSEENKIVRFVLYGLPIINADEVKNHLNNIGLNPTFVRIINPKNTRSSETGIYCVSFKKGSVTLNQLRNTKYVYHCVCRWEYYALNNIGPTQCRRCGMFGHGEINCNMKPKCNYCKVDHDGMDCPLKEDETKHVCSNCNGNHPTNSRVCPRRAEYVRMKQNIQDRNFVKQKRYVSFKLNDKEFPQNAQQSQSQVDDSFPPLLPPTTLPGTSYASRVQLNQDNIGLNQNDSDLFNTNELMNIFNEIITGLQNCQTKYDQVKTLTAIALKYVGFP